MKRVVMSIAAMLVLAGLVSAEGGVSVEVRGNVLAAQAAGDVAGAQVTVTGPGGFVLERSFAPGEAVVLSLAEPNGAGLPDGQYSFEVVWSPRAGATRGADGTASQAVAAAPRAAGTLRVSGGQAALPAALPERSSGSRRTAPSATSAPPTPDDFVIADDLVVQGSGCIGLDCVNGEVFGFDTIRMKENNTRIQFDDTSAAGFPTNNWQIRANDSAAGGANFLGIVDQGASGNSQDGTVVFRVTAGAPASSLHVDSTGRVGLRTSTPVLDLHIKKGDTPAMRLEQDGSSGYTPQTWDIAGNEANFFVRDVTGGSRLPLRIRPGAPTSSIDISASGNVGIGLASPSSALHVRRSDGTAKLLVEETSGTAAARNLLQLINNGASTYRFDNTSTGVNWGFGSTGGNNFFVSPIGAAALALSLTQTGNMTINGTLTQGSDRNGKDDISAVDPATVLAKVAELPIASWRYRGDEAIHVGPMAQDFHATFGLGADDKHIAPGDLAGLSLAAIQALKAEVAQKDARIQALEERLSKLEAALQK